MSDQLIVIVNYHYVRQQAQDKGIHALCIDDFKKQLDLIADEGYEFISLENLMRAVENKNTNHLKKRSCLITFDDGLKESFDDGLSVLDSKGIPAAFFVIGDNIAQKKVSSVHKFHYIRSVMEDVDVIQFLKSKIGEESFNINEAVLKEQYPWDSLLGAKVKYLFNFVLTELRREEIIKALFDLTYSKTEEDYAKELYMNKQQIKNLSNRKYLGTHSNNHRVLALLNDAELKKDITDSINNIFTVTQKKVEAISYPYGGLTAVDEKVASTCAVLGLKVGLTMFRGVNRMNDVVNQPMMLKRMDANDMIGGKSQHIYQEMVHG